MPGMGSCSNRPVLKRSGPTGKEHTTCVAYGHRLRCLEIGAPVRHRAAVSRYQFTDHGHDPADRFVDLRFGRGAAEAEP